ncbi:MAG: MBOAT family protein [Acetobacteraceae bacterium]|nr:MBOAT family protein [Acetobacteraceae bacterium]
MLFYEPLFLFVFFPTFYLLYLIGERRKAARHGIILVGSIVFYTWSEPLFVPLVLASSALDHVLARHIARRRAAARGTGLALATGVAINLAILIYYKYTGFLLQNLNDLLAGTAAGPIPVLAIVLPVGVSFIVFEKISYLVDVHRGASAPAERFLTYLLYVFFFPKLLAGPILKYHEMDAQLRAVPAARFDDIASGFLRFMLGVAKKTLIADTLANGADAVFGADPAIIGWQQAWLGAIVFAFQIYFDFSAYSDMAIGIGRMLGFRLRENFDMPYIACSMSEFWRRWHISLTTWIREYLYVPLGGNRVPPARLYLNLWICFLASGVWHGAAWTYVAWGAYNGLFLVLERLFLRVWLDRLPRVVANLLTFAIVVVGWTFFRAHSIGQALALLRTMALPDFAPHPNGVWIKPDVIDATILAAAICALPRMPGFHRLRRFVFDAPAPRLVWQTALALLFVVAVGKGVADPFKPFLYFRF